MGGTREQHCRIKKAGLELRPTHAQALCIILSLYRALLAILSCLRRCECLRRVCIPQPPLIERLALHLLAGLLPLTDSAFIRVLLLGRLAFGHRPDGAAPLLLPLRRDACRLGQRSLRLLRRTPPLALERELSEAATLLGELLLDRAHSRVVRRQRGLVSPLLLLA